MANTHSWLVLEPIEVGINETVRSEYQQFGWKVRIPVSPSDLTHQRDADHTETYGIASGGLLQRNLPKLWRTSIKSYLPSRITERFFHAKWDGGDEAYSQQDWIDYINLLMKNKQPLRMWHEDSPELRLVHGCTDWCITHFEYTLLPHDDIDYRIDLVEWKEPKCIVGEVLVNAEEEPKDTPKKVKGGGVKLLVFGSYDNRAVDYGVVYTPTIRGEFAQLGLHLGFKNAKHAKECVEALNPDDSYYMNEIRASRSPYEPAWSWKLWEMKGFKGHGTLLCRLDTDLPDGVIPAMSSLYRNIAATCLENWLRAMLPTTGLIRQSRAVVGYDQSSEEVEYNTQAISGGSSRRHLTWDAWCDKLSTVDNFQELVLKPIKFKYDGFRHIPMELGDHTQFEYDVTLEFELKTKYKTAYIVRPIEKGNPDLVYAKTQSWLTPKENTMEAGYKYYLKTVKHKGDELGLNVERSDVYFGTTNETAPNSYLGTPTSRKTQTAYIPKIVER